MAATAASSRAAATAIALATASIAVWRSANPASWWARLAARPTATAAEKATVRASAAGAPRHGGGERDRARDRRGRRGRDRLLGLDANGALLWPALVHVPEG